MKQNTTLPRPHAASEDGPRVIEILESYLKELEAGQAPAKHELLAQHPDIADQLSDCLEGLEFICQAASQVKHSGEPRDVACGEPEDVSPRCMDSLDVLGDFRIIRELGRGGMGVVYEAEQISLKRRVALKVLPFASTLDARQLQRFKNEAQAAAHLHHTNIVPVFATGCERGVHFYAMQYIDGQSLAEVIAGLKENTNRRDAEDTEKKQQTDPESSLRSLRLCGDSFFRQVAQIGMQAAEALDHAHQMGIVHRDVKPANLMLDQRGNLWVTDFGLAQFNTDTKLTLTGDLLGTLRYASPEQALAQPVVVDHRTDVYSLGATLYELLTLQPVVMGNSREEVLRRLGADEPPPQLPRDVPNDLATIVLKALARTPAERYVTAQALADDLRSFLASKPILARLPPWHLQARRWLRRHHKVVRAAAVGAVLTAIVAVGVLAAFRARHQAETVASQHQARQALRELIAGAERWEGGDADPTPDPREFQQLLQFYETLTPDGADDPTFRHEAAQLMRLVGSYHARFKEPDKAVQAYARAIALFDQLVAEFPTDPSYREELASTWQRRAELRNRGQDAAEADAAWTKARDLLHQLATESPREPRYRFRLAMLYQQQPFPPVARLSNDPRLQQAEERLRKAIALLEALCQEDPNSRSYQSRLIMAGNRLAMHLTQTERREAGEELKSRVSDLAMSTMRGVPEGADRPPGLLDGLSERRTVPRSHEEFGLLELVQLPRVRQLVTISADEAAAFARCFASYRQEKDAYYQNLEKLDRQSRPVMWGWGGREERQAQEGEVQRFVGDERFARLEQIRLQIRGLGSLAGNKLVIEFGISKEQREQINKAGREHGLGTHAAYAKAATPAQRAEIDNQRREALHQRLWELLTPDQQERWRQRIGDALDAATLRELDRAANVLANPTYYKDQASD